MNLDPSSSKKFQYIIKTMAGLWKSQAFKVPIPCYRLFNMQMEHHLDRPTKDSTLAIPRTTILFLWPLAELQVIME